ncbi:hypothetical protein SDC9_46847 [bioreactor metagenome]|uniref:Uncharacterized protein n=1 Tax=bioreactor metagenome TaxID=1076179 RepID=A0A644W9Z9_9ZZZZ
MVIIMDAEVTNMNEELQQTIAKEAEIIRECQAIADKHKVSKAYRLCVKVDHENSTETATAYFRKPNRVEHSAALLIERRDPLRAKEILLRAMFLEGDMRVLDNDYAFMCASLSVPEFIHLQDTLCVDDESLKECELIAKKNNLPIVYKLSCKLDHEENDKVATAFFRKPTRTEFGESLPFNSADPHRADSIILEHSFLEGDKAILENDYAFMCAAKNVDDIVGLMYGDLKKN